MHSRRRCREVSRWAMAASGIWVFEHSTVHLGLRVIYLHGIRKCGSSQFDL